MIHRVLSDRSAAIHYVTKTSSATLTRIEAAGGIVTVNATSAATITVPAASGQYKGRSLVIGSRGAGTASVYVAAGYGGGTGATDTVTLTKGQLAVLACDGSYWYTTGTPA